ncbi:MAG: hypothetical protein ACHRXM_11425 [Isosphaerales bacterium]
MNIAMLLLTTMAAAADPAPDLTPTEPFEAPKYGVTTRIPKAWPIAVHEEEDRIFVAIIPQQDFDRPGVAACELALAPESLDEYRTRIDTNAKKNGRPSGKLATNRLIKDARGERLETVWEFHPDAGGFWREVSVRMIANRQLYTFILNVEDSVYAKVRPAFDALIVATAFTAPNTGADLLAKASNRWIQREYKFALDLPEGWGPVLAPSEVALLFANGPPHGVWSDNLLVLAHPHRNVDLQELVKQLPDQLRNEDPHCEIISCKVIEQGKAPALETVVRTSRGPFSMTVIERRFRGGRFDYEVKYTVESKRFDELVPKFRQSFDSFKEVPGTTPAAKNKAA